MNLLDLTMMQDATGAAHDDLVEFGEIARSGAEADALGTAQFTAGGLRGDECALRRAGVNHDVMVVEIVPAIDPIIVDAIERFAARIAELVEPVVERGGLGGGTEPRDQHSGQAASQDCQRAPPGGILRGRCGREPTVKSAITP